MKKAWFILLCMTFLSMTLLSASALAQGPEGLIIVESQNDVDTTLSKLEAMIDEVEGLNVMSVIDHQANAEGVGLELRPTRVVLFGNPNAGTPLMQAAQSVAIDLPQKMLIWEDENGTVFLGYNDPEYLKTRHGIEGADEGLTKISGLLDKLASGAAQP